MKLQAKLILAVVPLIVAPLLVLGLIGYKQLHDRATEQMLSEMTGRLVDIERNFYAELRNAKANLELFANSSLLQKYALTTDERERYRLMLPPLLRLFSGYQKAYPEYYEIRFLLPDGYEDARATVGALPNATEEEGESAWFAGLRTAGEEIFTTTRLDPDSGRESLLVARAMALRDETVDPIGGAAPLRGYLAISVDLEFLHEEAHFAVSGSPSRILFFDGAGRALFGTHDDSAEHSALPDELFPDLRRAVSDRIPVIASVDGARHFLLGRQLRDDLFVVGMLPEARLLAASRDLSRLTAAVTIVAISLTAALLLIFLRAILLRPIHKLNTAAQEIGRGNLDVQIDIGSRDEIGDLARSVRDMTRNLAESREKVRAYQVTLEAKVEQRTSELLRAKDEAVEASQAKSNFLARMSHEIRTPMIGVLGMTDLLSRTELGGRQRRLVGILRQSAETLLNIINDILDFSRIEAGKLALDRVDFELSDLVADVCELLADTAQSKGLEIVYSIANDLPAWLSGDPHRLRQVLMNLIGNAIKFTDEGEVEIRIAPGKPLDRGLELMFQVRDTGIGIEGDRQAELFKPFEQADGSISRRFGGTGLGLSIAKQLVTMMDGELGIVSKRGEGTTSWFTARFETARDQAVTGQNPLANLAGARILIVDDNATNRIVLGQFLRTAGAECSEAESGAEALKALGDAAAVGSGFDAALLDMAMPGMTGLELARAVKAAPDIAETSLILLTSIGWRSDEEKDEAWHFDGSLTKPVRSKELCQLVSRALGGATAEDQAASAGASPGGSDPILSAHVLLAEDNPVNQEVAREYLEALGCAVEIAGTGVAAIAAFRKGNHDIILMDCEMPEKSGLEASRIIREEESAAGATARIPIVAVTAFTTEGERERCLAAGMDDYLAKPFDQPQLLAMLRRWLPENRCRPEPEPGSAPAASDNATMAMKSEDAAIDHVVLERIRSVGRKSGRPVLEKIIGIYLEHTPDQLGRLAAAIETGEGLAVAELAHGLKSSSANLGATTLVELLKSLEHQGREGSLAEAARTLGAIEAEFEKVGAALRAELRADSALRESA